MLLFYNSLLALIMVSHYVCFWPINRSQDESKVIFRIQLGLTDKQPLAGSKVMRDFPDVEAIRLEDGKMRLYTGKYETFTETEEHVKQALAKGYKYATVVAFYKGKRISVEKALELIYSQ